MNPKRLPRPRSATPSRHTLSYQLREVIDARGLTAYAVGQLAGVDAGVVQRFVTGKRDILMATADRVAGALGLRLVEVARKGRPPGRGTVAPSAEPASAVASDPDGDGDGEPGVVDL